MAANAYATGIGPTLESRGEPYEYHGTGKIVAESGTSYSADGSYSMNAPIATGGNSVMVQAGLLTQYAKTVVNPGESFMNNGGIRQHSGRQTRTNGMSRFFPSHPLLNLQFN